MISVIFVKIANKENPKEAAEINNFFDRLNEKLKGQPKKSGVRYFMVSNTVDPEYVVQSFEMVCAHSVLMPMYYETAT
ncbi:MAG: hypothetical protein V4490_02185, partial [Pseudomonadota bacterium]